MIATTVPIRIGCTSLSNYRSAYGPEGPQVILAASNGATGFSGENTSFLPEAEVRVPVNEARSVVVGVKAFAGGASLDRQYAAYQSPRFAAADLAVEYTQEGSDLVGSDATRYATVTPAGILSYRATDWLELSLMVRTPVTLQTGPGRAAPSETVARTRPGRPRRL
ncbi:MAG: hypothetical protein ACOCYC_00375 [bacterium]